MEEQTLCEWTRSYFGKKKYFKQANKQSFGNKHKRKRKSFASESNVFGNKRKGESNVCEHMETFSEEYKSIARDFNKDKVLRINVKGYTKKCERTKFCNLTQC